MRKLTQVRARLGAVGALAVVGSTIAIAAVPLSAQAKSKPLTRSAVIALIKQYSKAGPRGQTGPPGPRGLQGTRGLQGNAGPTYSAGTGLTLAGSVFSINPNSNVFGVVLGSAVSDTAVGIPADITGYIAGASFSTAGNYVVFGTTSVQNSTASPVGLFCFLETASAKIAEAQETVPANDSVNLTVQGVVLMTNGDGGVDLVCTASAASALSTVTSSGLDTSAVTAIKAANASLLP
jgi:hypothetical protein